VNVVSGYVTLLHIVIFMVLDLKFITLYYRLVKDSIPVKY